MLSDFFMSLPAPISITPVSAPDLNIGLRLNQRVSAQVISVTGVTAILEVDGHPIVAQLTSSDQAALLTSQRMAQFLVTELTSETITLKFIRNDPTPPAAGEAPSVSADLSERILLNANLPANASNLTLTRAMLQQHLPFTPELLKELQNALGEFGAWTEDDANLAAALKSAGLPVTGQSLALMSRPSVETAATLAQLIQTLTQSTQGATGELQTQLTRALRALNSTVIRLEDQPSKMAERLKMLAQLLGRSLENILLEPAQGNAIPENSLVMLARLQRTFEQLGQREAAQAIQESLSDIRQSQFLNVKPDPVPGQGEWSEIGFMLHNPKAGTRETAARLRIAHEAKADSSRINPAYTRLILQVDLDAEETVEVDLALVGKQIRPTVTAPDPLWCEKARDEAASLTEALSRLGYNVKDVQVGVGDPKPFQRVQVKSGSGHLMTVNIEV